MLSENISCKKILSLILLLFAICSTTSRGQSTCTLTADAGSPIAICSPSIVQLNGGSSAVGANIRSISWLPTTGLSNPTVFNPTANVSSPITYHLTVNAFADSNLFTNPNFDNGINGYSTTYVPGTGGSFGLLSVAATYAINTNPRNTHNNFAIFGDHTTGSGNMFVVNGDTSSSLNPMLCQSVTVIPNTNYQFSVWGASCVNSSPAVLQLQINGVTQPSTFTLSTLTGLWQQYTVIWNSASITSATICLIDQNIQESGNDFALDDFSFREICIAEDSVTVSLGAIGVMNLGADSTLCSGQNLLLNATVTNATRYVWNTGDTTAQITVDSTGLYIATASFGGVCPTSDTINITVRNYPVLDLGGDTSICNNDSVFLDATASFATSYLWHDGNTSPTRYASSAGHYSVIASNGRCRSYDTVAVRDIVIPPFSLGNDTSICMPDSIQLEVPFFPGTSYTWYDGSHGLTNAVTNPGVYWVEIQDSGCAAKEYITISPGDCGSVFIPNVFTPNNDTKNETWQVFQFSAVSMNVKIFNRWGQLMFTSDDMNFQWDGTYKNNACTQGVYYYVITGIFLSGDEFTYKGPLTLLR